MSSNNNDQDTPMEHGDLPVRTTVNAQEGQAPAPGNTAPSGNNNGTPAVPPVVGGGQAQAPSGTGSSFHGAMGFSVGLGGGGRGGRGGGVGGGRGGRGGHPGRGGFTAPRGNATFGVAGGGSLGSGAGGRGGLNSGVTGAGGGAASGGGAGAAGAGAAGAGAGVFGGGFGGGAGAGFGGAGAGANAGAGGFGRGSGAGFGAGFGRGVGGNQNSGGGYNSGRGGRGNSGSGWGNFGRGQGRGQGRGHYNRGRGHNNRGAITKRPTLKIVPRITTIELREQNGRHFGLAASNPTPGGGPQDGIAVYRPHGGLGGVLKGEDDAAMMLRRTKENTGANRVWCEMRPLVDNANEVARRRRLIRVVDHTDSPTFGLGHSAGLLGDKKKKEEKKKPAAVEHMGDEHGMECVLCEKKTHDINTCLNQPSGHVAACVLCHDKRHSLDSCSQYNDMVLTDRIRLLVDGRAGLPPLLTEIPWWEMLLCWLQDDVSQGETLPVGFPWTMDHTRGLCSRARGRYIKELQVTFDTQDHNRSLLPQDEGTATIVKVFHTYWETQGFTWPQRLVEMGFSNPRLDVAGPEFVPGAATHQTAQDQRMEGQEEEEGEVLPNLDLGI
ncbi:hypothetical protein FOVSG1_002206 [Fusarium oxysporum f. sp. vasinfectum]